MANVSKAIKVITAEIKNDPGYKIGWASNIAMAFYDAFKNSPHGPDIPNDELHEIANRAANNFLNLLCQDTK